MSRAEWIGLAVFAVAGLLALPLVRDAFLIQQIWVALCSAVRL